MGTGSPYGTVFQWNENTPTTCILQGWESKIGGNTVNGKGYSVFATGGSTLSVTGTPNHVANVSVGPFGNSGYNLPTLQSSGIYSFESGWHLVASPYSAGYSFTLSDYPGFDDAAMYVPGGAFSGTYPSIAVGTTNLAPFQGIMVHVAGGSQTFTWLKAKRNLTASIQFNQQNGDEELGIELSGNGFLDNTYISFDNTASNQFDIGKDSRKQRSDLGQPTIYTGANTLRVNL